MLLDCHTHITTGRSIENVFAHLELYGKDDRWYCRSKPATVPV